MHPRPGWRAVRDSGQAQATAREDPAMSISVEMRAQIIGDAAADPKFTGQGRRDHVKAVALEQFRELIKVSIPDPLADADF